MSEVKELYQISDNTMCVKMVVTNADRIGTKYFVDTEAVKEIKETELKKILPSLKVSILRDMLKCYNCQYSHFCINSVTDSDRKKISNWYQPKHLLENLRTNSKLRMRRLEKTIKNNMRNSGENFLAVQTANRILKNFLMVEID